MEKLQKFQEFKAGPATHTAVFMTCFHPSHVHTTEIVLFSGCLHSTSVHFLSHLGVYALDVPFLFFIKLGRILQKTRVKKADFIQYIKKIKIKI